jgi:alpha-tubulin suppressor-like RCC1 family protein
VYAWGYGKAIGNKTRHITTPQKCTPKHIESSVVISLAGGDCHSMVLYECGVVFTWGNNYEVR